MEAWIVIGGYTLLFAVFVAGFVLANVRHKKRAKEKPPAHRGTRQSQRGRVYKKGVTNRSAWQDLY